MDFKKDYDSDVFIIETSITHGKDQLEPQNSWK